MLNDKHDNDEYVNRGCGQARSHGMTKGVQWFLPDTAAMDHIFDFDENNRDAGLAYDMRGTLGLRICTPLTGAKLNIFLYFIGIVLLVLGIVQKDYDSHDNQSSSIAACQVLHR